MILIYSIQRSKRLEYAAEIIFKHILKLEIPITFTCEPDEYLHFQGRKINYSQLQMAGGIHIPATDFLYQTGTKTVFPGVAHGAYGKVLFPVDGSKDFGFDIFSAVFFMVTRYEETASDIPFQPEESIAFKNNFLDKPIVHYWVEELKDQLMLKYPTYIFPKKKFKNEVMIISLHQYAFLGRRGKINFIDTLKDIFTGQWKRMLMRLHVITGNKKDPLDQLKFHRTVAQKCKQKMLFIVFPPSVYTDQILFPSFVRKVLSFAKLGYFVSASDDLQFINEQSKSWPKLSPKKFMNVLFDVSVQSLLNGYHTIQNLKKVRDYSMCYPQNPGFRAGITETYPWYDLKSEEKTSIYIRPVAFHASAFADTINTNPEQVSKTMLNILQEVRMAKGTLISCWDENQFSKYPQYRNIKKLYIQLMKAVAVK